ncbi:Type IV pilus biogenesis and competence protein PilQ precursor [Pseudomonas oleovorans subsp. oleovorans]|uniref:Type IV pilus secretin PilQ n=1 Tax=Ectopseudomonas oleovorans TaxID=301 RepID=A0A379JTD7_ECTOL|nr:type IV pilus secretin PilQ [Pseudomonas oleovorans]OWK44921.1 Type IV pilus biogenesis and competence protein PilQ precursor [Pseudomonas oleovorans subsp. oleovorans]SEI56550.1 type IV pilus assembly protein PilQ [Pseudomonas oleovorans]SUD51788.1 type IV pilus secretin PilQ [Pseudomonas oleovorans]
MNSSLSRLSVALLAALLSPAVLAANLQDLNVASLPGDRVELKLSFDEPVTAPRGYTIEQPARIALDLPGVSNKLGSKNRELGVGNARSVTIVEAKDRTRLIVNLTSLAPYSTRVEGNDLYVLVGDSSAVASRPSASVPASVAAVPPKKTYGPQPKTISNIDFQRGEQGEGNVVITLSDASISPDIQEQGGKIRLDFAKTDLPESLRVRLDVKDFATPVQFVSATGSADRTSIVIEPVGLYDYLAYQTENRLTLSVKPLTQDDVERRKAERFAYTGEKLSLNFQDIDVRSVLQLIADFTDLNLVASDTVAGNITLRLQNVPWDQALDLVLKTKGLDKRQVGNVLLVAPADEIAARERQELESQKQIAELAPLRRELIQVNYAKAADMAKLFQSVTSADGASSDARGSVTVDDRTNSIIAYQTQDRLDELRRIIAQLDIPVRQVMIEARIVEANVDYDKALGVRWGGATRRGNWSVYGKDGATSFDNESGQVYLPGTDTVGNVSLQDGVARVPFVDMGVLGSTSGIGIGFLTDNVTLDLQLSAMEKTGNGEIVSQPKVVTSDKETAKILKGQEVPYQEASSSGATSTSFKEAALSLEVTPQITPDNRIIMEVKVTKDAPDFARALNGGVPPINKNEVNAKVLVNDGETIVIGGVFSNTQTKGVEKVPFLGDLPFLGRVFRRDIVSDNKAELLVFITPRIMNNQAIAVNR